MKMLKGFIIICIGLMALVGTALGAEVDYPNKPINVYVSAEPGSGTDTMLRVMGPIVYKILDQPLIIDNKPGGSGVLAFELLKRAKPDGYTLLAGTDAALTRMPHMFKVEYDLQRDISSLIMLYTSSAAVLVRSDSPFKTFKDLIKYARENPGKLTVGLPSISSAIKLGFINIAKQEKVEFQYIPFQGGAPTITAILGGHVMSTSLMTSSYRQHVKSGALRALMVFGHERFQDLLEVPCSSELGYAPEVSDLVHAPSGVVTLKAVPKAIKDKLISALSKAITSPEYRNLASQYALTVPDPPLVGEALDKHYLKLYNLYGPYVKELGVEKK